MTTFEQIYGNEYIVKNLQNSISYKRVSHAYIFSGQKGIGKKLMGDTFAKTLQCEAGGKTPCNLCSSCHLFDARNHPDVFHIRPTKAASIGVDDIRDYINKPISLKPFKYKYKIFIIENSEKLTIPAQNALLKTIEEPGSYGIFILLTETIGSFLPTILSRCVILKLKPVPLPEVEKFLTETSGQDKEDAATYAVFSRGNIGLALSLLNDENFLNMRNEILNIPKDIKGFNYLQITKLAKELENYKNNINQVLEILFYWFRDMAVFKKTGDENFITQKDKKNMLLDQLETYSLSSVLNNMAAIRKSERQLKYNGNFNLVLEVLLLKLKE